MNRHYRPPSDREDVAVTCWCEETIVYIPAMEVRRGRTRSCGRPQCKPKEK